MTVLVIGGSGFIGKHLHSHLSMDRHALQTREVILWNREVHGSILDLASAERVLRSLQPAVVVNLAWASTANPLYDVSNENEVWLEASLRLAISVTHASSLYVTLGSGAELIPGNLSPYGRAKAELLRGLQRNLPLDGWTWIRPQWIFSPTEGRPRLLQAAAEAASQGRDFTPNNPDAYHDWIHVKDVAAAIDLAVAQRIQGVVDVATGHSFRVSDFLERVRGIGDQGRESVASAIVSPLQPSRELVAAGWEPTVTRQLLGLGSSTPTDQ
jgi:nucleoside-diphosphate-sugar epimerase